jgi:CheY-like chemotaxis protein
MQAETADRDAGGEPEWRLLVCDDSATERSSLSQILQRRGYDVDEASDGAAALRMIKARPYDLLLLDLQMPGTDGFDVLAFVQKNQPELPVVVLSGLPPEEIGSGIGRLPDLELPPLLLKPIDTKQLFQVIELKLAGELP